MIDSDWKRLRRQARAIARRPLYLLLQWATYHALKPIAGRPLDGDTLDRATVEIQRAFDQLADRGAFRYFGIFDSSELGPMPIAIVQVTGDGACMLAADQVIEAIMSGGRKGEGWGDPKGISIDDLAN